MLIVLLALRLAYAQYTSYNAVAVRLPGRCLPGDFDCGFGRCVPVKVFHDGKPDCYDGSDEWCFFGHIKCGAYCVDMSHALSCLFSSKCDDSSRQPQWCSLSKEKLCGDPSSFPCKGYGECVLWEWLLDGKKDCIDGSDEDQSYVRTLETSFRCYYNRTKKVAMPTPLNYTQAFLRITNPMLPGFRPPPPPPQFPTLFPPVLSHTPPPIHITPPPTITLPPPVQLSRITGLPPLPPPYPTLLLTPRPSNPIPLPITSRPHSLLYSTTVGTVYVPEISTTPNDPFVSPNSVMTTGITPIHPIDSGYSLSGQGLQTLSSATSAPVFSTIQSSTPSEQTMSPSTKKRGFGHVRGRGRTTTTTPSVGTTAKITHIKVGIVDVKEGNKTGKQELDMITNNNDVLEIFGNNVGIEEEDSNGRTIPLSHVDLSSKENEAGLVTFPHASPSDVTVSSRTSNYDIDLTQDVYGNLNPKFQATKHPLTGHSIADDRIQSAKSSSSEMGVVHVTTESHLSMKNSSTDAAKNKTVLPPASGDVVQTAGRAAEDVSSSVSTGGVEASVQNKCLADLVDNSKKKYSNYKCECPTGEWAVGRKCEAHEADMAFYKLDIHSACGENKLTTEQKKWIAIGKIAENLKIPSCARTTSAGNVIVNSFCGNHCTLKDFGDLTRESASDTRKVTIEEAPLCEDSSTNYCHRYAICTVEDVHLKCVCKKGTNDTSNGLGRICEGVPGDDDCIMILGACLIFWLIILLGLLLLVPLLIFLLSHCCPGRGNLIHPKKDGLNLHGKGSGTRSGAQESKHIAAIMSSLLEKNAGGTREMAMKMALAELKKREQEVEKTTTVPAQPKMARLEDAHAITSSKIINNPSANSITQISGNINGAPLMMKEISSIPGTVPAPYGETPILDKIPPPMIEVLKPSTPDKSIGLTDRNPLGQRSISQHSFTVTDSNKAAFPSATTSAPVVGDITSVPIETSTPKSAAAPISVPSPTPPPPAPPPAAPSPASVPTTAPQPPPSPLPPPPLPSSPPPPPPPPPPSPPQQPQAPSTIPAVVEVHQSSEPHDRKLARSISTHSVGVQPTIWESYKALGDVYAKRDNIDRKGSSSSLDALIYSRYPHMATTLIAPLPATPNESFNVPPPPTTTTTTATTEPTFMPSVIVPGPKTEDTIQTSSALSSTVTERSERNHRLAEMLGVTLDDSSYSSSPTQEKPSESRTLDKTDDQIVEEMTLQGIMLPIPLTNEAELLRDEKIIETAPQITLPSHIESDVKTDSDADPVPILPALSVVPDVEVTESDSGKQESSQRKEKTATTSVVSNNAVFMPKKAREQQKEKESLKTSPNHRFATKSTIGSRQLLKPPERYMHSSTEESDPEVAVFKRLARTGRVKETIPLTRRKLRRPERQLSSISEKSAEIAAEAALQNQPQDYSISAPNTTRSITEWQRYVPKHTFSSADFSDTQTDVDIPKQTKKSTLTTKSKQVPEIQKKRKPSDQQLSKKRETKEIKPNIQGRQQLRPCQMPSTSTSVPKEPVKKARRSTQSSSSPEIPDVTLRRSVHRLDLLDRSPNRNSSKEASTSGSQISAGTKFQRTSDLNREQQINIHVKQLKEKVEESPTWTSDYGTAVRMSRTGSLPKEEIPHTSRTVHHAVISRKIATRRHETHITKSTGDLTLEESCSLSSMDRVATISRSAENLHNRRRTWDSSACESDDKFDSLYSRPQWDYSPHKSEHRSENLYSRPYWDSSPYKSDGRSKNLDSRTQWDSSPHKPDDKFKMHQEPFLPQIKPTAKYYQKSRSVLNSPLGPHQRSSSKFSLTSLPARCSSTLEFSPYFTPGGDSDKPPKEDLWWGPAPRSFR